MRDLNYQLKQLCGRNRDGSYATQCDRARILPHVASQLHDLGYSHMNADSLRPKHVLVCSAFPALVGSDLQAIRPGDVVRSKISK